MLPNLFALWPLKSKQCLFVTPCHQLHTSSVAAILLWHNHGRTDEIQTKCYLYTQENGTLSLLWLDFPLVLFCCWMSKCWFMLTHLSKKDKFWQYRPQDRYFIITTLRIYDKCLWGFTKLKDGKWFKLFLNGEQFLITILMILCDSCFFLFTLLVLLA